MRRHVTAILLALVLSVAAHAQITTPTARYVQGPFTVTTGTVVKPSTCNDAGAMCGAATPSWNAAGSGQNTSFCKFTVVGAALNYTLRSASTPVTGTNPTTGGQWAPGEWFVFGHANLVAFRMVGATANVNVTIECGW